MIPFLSESGVEISLTSPKPISINPATHPPRLSSFGMMRKMGGFSFFPVLGTLRCLQCLLSEDE